MTSDMMPGTPQSSSKSNKSSRGRRGEGESTGPSTKHIPKPEVVSDSGSTGCNYIRGTSLTTRLPEDAHAYVPSINDPLTAPLSSITDDYNNFGGGVNPLGYKGHTFTANGYGPVYFERPQAPDDCSGSRSCGGKTCSKNSSFSKTKFERDYDAELMSPSTSVVNCDGVAEQAPGTTSANDASDEENITEWPVLGPVWPPIAKVSLLDLGESDLFTDNVYLAWRIIYFATCFAAVIIAINVLGSPAMLSSCLAVLFAAVAAIAGLRRVVQYRLVIRFGQGYDSVDVKRSLSWFDVILRQGAPVVCIVFGLMMPGLFSELFTSRGINVAYYDHVTFYMTLAVCILTIFDIWIGSIPTRATYVVVIITVNSILALYCAWGFRAFVIMLIVVISAVSGFIFGLLLHIVSRMTLQKARIQAIETPHVNDKASEGEDMA